MGGAGDALPASIASLMYPATLAAMTTRPRAPALATHASPRPTTALAKKASREKTLLASPSAREAIGVAAAARRVDARARVVTGATPVGAESPRAMSAAAVCCALRLSVCARANGGCVCARVRVDLRRVFRRAPVGDRASQTPDTRRAVDGLTTAKQNVDVGRVPTPPSYLHVPKPI